MLTNRARGRAALVAAFALAVCFTSTRAQEQQPAPKEGVTDKVKEKLLAQIPLRRFGSAEEVARAVCYLVSADGDYITGAELSINGGLLM